MYEENIDKGRLSLGRVLHKLQRVISIEDCFNDPKHYEKEVVFMKIRAETGEGYINAAAVMASSYASHLRIEFEQILLNKNRGIQNKTVRQTMRSFNCLFESPFLRSAKRAHMKGRIRDHAGIPLYGKVFVAERNGYAVISPNRNVIEEIEAAPLYARITTIDNVVAGIVKEMTIEQQEVAVLCKYP